MQRAPDPSWLGGFADRTGFAITAASPDEVVLEWDVRPDHHQPYGIVHGGVYCSAIESAASIAAAVWFGERGQVVGVNNNTDFLRAVTDGHLTARATPLHRGRSQQLWQVAVTDDQDRLVARGQVRLQNLSR
jgi:1,4-dihydroxy-2-naphthoyl-CoA hydrolase